jgi:hypothetical protein
MNPESALLLSQEPLIGGPFSNFINSLFFMVRSFNPLAQTPVWRTTSYRLTAVMYSIYSHLPSTSKVFFIRSRLYSEYLRLFTVLLERAGREIGHPPSSGSEITDAL